MKKSLLKKIAVGASAFLLLGGVASGTSLAKDASANGVPGVPMYMNYHQNKFGKYIYVAANAYNHYLSKHPHSSEYRKNQAARQAYLRYMKRHHLRFYNHNVHHINTHHNRKSVKRIKRTKRNKRNSKRANDIKRLRAVNKHDHARIFAHFGKNKFSQYGKGGVNRLPYSKTNWAVRNFTNRY